MYGHNYNSNSWMARDAVPQNNYGMTSNPRPNQQPQSNNNGYGNNNNYYYNQNNNDNNFQQQQSLYAPGMVSSNINDDDFREQNGDINNNMRNQRASSVGPDNRRVGPAAVVEDGNGNTAGAPKNHQNSVGTVQGGKQPALQKPRQPPPPATNSAAVVHQPVNNGDDNPLREKAKSHAIAGFVFSFCSFLTFSCSIPAMVLAHKRGAPDKNYRTARSLGIVAIVFGVLAIVGLAVALGVVFGCRTQKATMSLSGGISYSWVIDCQPKQSSDDVTSWAKGRISSAWSTAWSRASWVDKEASSTASWVSKLMSWL